MKPACLSREEARQRAARIRDLDLAVTLDLTAAPDTGATTFPSTTRLRFACVDPGPGTFLDLQAERVEEVVLNGVTLAPDCFDGTRVHLPELAGDNEVLVRAHCRYSRAGVGLHRFVDPVDKETFLYSQFEPFEAHRVFAAFDQPDLKAPFALTVDAPTGWEVVSNAPVETRPEPGMPGRWVFQRTQPISSYITAIVAGPYHRVGARHGDIEMALYCRRSLAPHLDPDEVFEITRNGLDYFTELFDYPYPFEKYDQLFVPEFNFGAMENPGAVTFSERHVFRSRVTDAARLQRANTILHEMAHMWFGDLVTMRWWDDLWLNESFATYTATLAVAEATRFEDSWADFAHAVKAWAYRSDQLPSTHPIVADMVDTDAVMANFDGITYAKGASVLKQLVAWVGRDAFVQGLRAYFPRHAWGNAELGDFLAALEQPSGRDLKPWSIDWLETAGVATLRADVEAGDGGCYERVVLHQDVPAEHPTLRAHRVALGVYDLVGGRLQRRLQVELDVEGGQTEAAALAGVPVGDLLLVNDDDLAYAKVRFDPASVRTLVAHLGTLAEPLARAVCWGALWDATRDAELATSRWVELVAAHAGGEDDIGVLQTLLAQARRAIDAYAAPEHCGRLRERMAAVARDQLGVVEPGSDRQLVWVRSLAGTRTDPGFARGLLDGSLEMEGLAVDADLRWALLSELAAGGQADADAIAAEEERDPTDIGARGAAAARAARPDAQAKAEAWALALGDEEPLATRRDVLEAFWQTGQEEVLADYARQGWVDALGPIWDTRSVDEALELTELLYPATVIGEEVVAAADEALEREGQLPGPYQRAIRESRDATLRALRARAADGG